MEGLSTDRYSVTNLDSSKEFCQFIEREKQQIDCLILDASKDLASITKWLHGQAILLPAIVLYEQDQALAKDFFAYHTAECAVTIAQLLTIEKSIEQAIAQFINLSPTCWVSRADSSGSETASAVVTDLSTQKFLMVQQQRLAEKLKERLGYLGVYYKRNPENFFRHLSLQQRQELLDELRMGYRSIVLSYFEEDGSLNQLIDDFVNTAFFADIAVAQVVEIHMDLMDEFSKQLKLEGRSEEILLDYRLTLIDTIAHLCEMYRRSIPRES